MIGTQVLALLRAEAMQTIVACQELTGINHTTIALAKAVRLGLISQVERREVLIVLSLD